MRRCSRRRNPAGRDDGRTISPIGGRSMCAGKRGCWTRWASAWICRECAATGATDDLIYVSPDTGRAVSREAARHLCRAAVRAAGVSCWARRTPSPTLAEIAAGLQLTGHFLLERVLAAARQARCRAARLRLGRAGAARESE